MGTSKEFIKGEDSFYIPPHALHDAVCTEVVFCSMYSVRYGRINFKGSYPVCDIGFFTYQNCYSHKVLTFK